MAFYDLGKPSILVVVDDDLNTIALMSDIVSGLGAVAVVTTPNGAMAETMLAYSQQAPMGPVFVDYQMGLGHGSRTACELIDAPQLAQKHAGTAKESCR